MSADNGFVIQKNTEGKFTLQLYFASADMYPDADDAPPDMQFDTKAEAALAYEGVEQMYAAQSAFIEYGLTFNVSNGGESCDYKECRKMIQGPSVKMIDGNHKSDGEFEAQNTMTFHNECFDQYMTDIYGGGR